MAIITMCGNTVVEPQQQKMGMLLILKIAYPSTITAPANIVRLIIIITTKVQTDQWMAITKRCCTSCSKFNISTGNT